MSADRDELRRLVEELPEERVPLALRDLRSRLVEPGDRPWPLAWFGSVTSRGADISSRVDELLAEGFAQPRCNTGPLVAAATSRLSTSSI